MFNNKVVLITGGTGSFGKSCSRKILEKYKPKKLIILSRDELKQHEMRQEFPDSESSPMRYFIGDVRDKDRLHRAFFEVDLVIHAAAMKQVPASEYNPFEAIKTNILGAKNVIDAAIDQRVQKVLALSTDKAANPVNLYGATKLCSDKLFIAGNSYTMRKETTFSVVRYGNVMGSRGSVIPFFNKIKETGELPITDKNMTRFWITLDQAVEFVFQCISKMKGGELFVPKLPSMKMTDLARAICPKCKHKIIGIRPGEKKHEVMIPRDDSRMAIEHNNYYVIHTDMKQYEEEKEYHNGKSLPDDFEYGSGTNSWLLGIDDMKELLGKASL